MAGLLYVPQIDPTGLTRPVDPGASSGQVIAQAGERAAARLSEAGDQVLQLADRWQRISVATAENQKKTELIKKRTALDEQFRNDPDPATAGKRYADEINGYSAELLTGLPPAARAQLETYFTHYNASAISDQQVAALKRQSDTTYAAFDAQQLDAAQRYAAAKTDGERLSVQGGFAESLNRAQAQGMITARAAEAYRLSVARTGDEAIALRAIGANPAMAVSALSDPARFSGLDPVRRQQLVDHANAAADERRSQEIVQEARFNPASAALKAGRLTDPAQAQIVFDKAIIAQESGGNPAAVSPDGAAGIAQIMPDTARGLVKQMGIGNWDALSDAEVRQRLKDDPAQSRRMGLEYFAQGLRLFDGSLPAAIAGYHAGNAPDGAVAAAHRRAVAKYGPTYSAEQFAAELPPSLRDGTGKTTASYVRDIYRRMGADTAQTALSPMGSWRLSNAVGNVLDQETARQAQIMNRVVSAAGREADALTPILRDGYAPDPDRVAAVRAPLALAAARGDALAAEKLRSFDEAIAIAPIVNQMFRTEPAQLEAQMAQARQAMAAGPVTPELARRVALGEKVLTEVGQLRRDNPQALLERQGIAQPTLVQIPPSLDDGPAMAAFHDQVARRAVNSTQAQALLGNGQFFKPEELASAKARWADMGPDNRFRLISALANAVPAETPLRVAVSELAGRDAAANTAALFVRRDPRLARDILTGSELLAQPGVKPKIGELRDGIANAFGGALYPPEVQALLIEASLAAYAAERGRNDALYDPQDRSALQAAVTRVIGRVMNVNGRKTPLPPGLADWEVRDMLRNLDAADLERIGGAYGENGRPLDAGALGRYGQFEPQNVGGGRYAMFQPGPGGELRAVLTKQGQQLVVDLPDLVKSVRAAHLNRPPADASIDRSFGQWDQGGGSRETPWLTEDQRYRLDLP